jgi:hypothetical protein
LLLALQARPTHSQAADSLPARKSGSAFPGESVDYTQSQGRTGFGQRPTQPPNQKASSVGEFQSDTRFRRQNRIFRELKTLIAGAPDDQTREVGESAPLALPTSSSESVSGFSRNALRSQQAARRFDESAMSISAVSVGSYPGARDVILWDNINIQTGQPPAISSAGLLVGSTTRKTIAAVASAFHLDTPQLGNFPPTTSEDPGSPTVGGSPPPLEGSISAAPEPSSAVLSSLASTAVLLRRRRVG